MIEHVVGQGISWVQFALWNVVDLGVVVLEMVGCTS
jgi:hypothetical protein